MDDNPVTDLAATVVVRVWLPDRPGALGAVASRIGAVQGDVIGIDILERGAGRAVDDIVVALPSEKIVDLLVKEINEVDGVDVEEVRVLADGGGDPWLDAVEAAAQLLGASTAEQLLESLCERALAATRSRWAVIVRLDTATVLAERGEAPSAAWLSAFVLGSQASARAGAPTGWGDDVTWVPLPSAGLALILGREGTAFRLRERRQAAALARIADGWVCSLRERSELYSRLNHPSRGVPAEPIYGSQFLDRSSARFHCP